eukprot:1444314-Pyramimonas_sp.AAC.1
MVQMGPEITSMWKNAACQKSSVVDLSHAGVRTMAAEVNDMLHLSFVLCDVPLRESVVEALI